MTSVADFYFVDSMATFDNQQNNSQATEQDRVLGDLGKKLLDACRIGDTEEVRSLMKSGAPFTTDWLGTSPLHFAAQFGHADTAEVLLKAGVSRDARTKVEKTALHLAAQEGHTRVVKLLLTNKADIDAQDMLKMTPLHWAVERGHTEVVELLLLHGADVSVTSKFEKTPIDTAYDTGRLELIPLLQKNVGICAPKSESNKSQPASTPSSSKASRTTVLPSKTPRTVGKGAKAAHQHQSLEVVTAVSSLTNATNFDNIRRALHEANLNTSNSDASNAAMLATIQAIANAASTNGSAANKSPSEALKWLEANRMTVPQDDNQPNDLSTHSMIISDKAINLMKEQKHPNNNISATTSSTNSSNSYITLMTDSAQFPNLINSATSQSQPSPLLLLPQGTTLTTTSNNQSYSPKNERVPSATSPNKFFAKSNGTSNAKSNTISSAHHLNDISINGNNNFIPRSTYEKLEKEIASLRKEVNDWKQKYQEKEREVSNYKKQLDHLTVMNGSLSGSGNRN